MTFFLTFDPLSFWLLIHLYLSNDGRFGSDVVDKSRSVTQKCVIMKVTPGLYRIDV